jgi:hypothetical protein
MGIDGPSRHPLHQPIAQQIEIGAFTFDSHECISLGGDNVSYWSQKHIQTGKSGNIGSSGVERMLAFRITVRIGGIENDVVRGFTIIQTKISPINDTIRSEFLYLFNVVSTASGSYMGTESFADGHSCRTYAASAANDQETLSCRNTTFITYSLQGG